MVKGGKAEPFFRKLQFKVYKHYCYGRVGPDWDLTENTGAIASLDPLGLGQPFRSSSVSNTSKRLRVRTEVVGACTRSRVKHPSPPAWKWPTVGDHSLKISRAPFSLVHVHKTYQLFNHGWIWHSVRTGLCDSFVSFFAFYTSFSFIV